jgi:uncharacterized membrane protein HdeD (DUF308 family)
METNLLNRRVKHWYLPLILGAILIAVGIWVLKTPAESYLALSMLFAYTFFITGILEIIYSVSNRNELEHWGWSLVGGIIDLLIGCLLISQPQMSMLILPFFVGFGILFRSLMMIGWSLFLRKAGQGNWTNLLFIGILGAIFSFILLWNPVFA